MGLKSFVSKITGDIPIVGDLINAAAGHASAKNLQNDAQAHDSHMFHAQAGHDKDMFGLESEFASAQAAKQYERQRALLQDSPRLQMQGLKSAGLNPILAATGGFKSPAGGSLPIPSARASSSAKGAGQGSPPGAKLALGQYALLREQANLTAKQAAKVEKETEFIGNKIDISEPIARAMDAIVRVAERIGQKNDEGKMKLIDSMINDAKESKQELRRLWQFIVDQYGNAQKAFEEIRRNKGVINLPNIEVKK
jgi:hypothetical protein